MHKKEVIDLIISIQKLIEASNFSVLVENLDNLKLQLEQPNIWQNGGIGNNISKQAKILSGKIDSLTNLTNAISEVQVALDLCEQELLNSTVLELKKLHSEYQKINYLSESYDSNNCLLTIQAGTGGVDAEDFAAILCSMYQAFCKKQNWLVQTVAISIGQEGGLKSVTLDIQGEYSYGLLKEEVGVHRLVRISPFNSGKTRETSFAAVEILPQGLEDEFKIDLKEEDLKWEYSTSSGNGGQSVNTTYSAVKLTHTPTGLTVSCQNERSQTQNKNQALKYLKNKLANLEWQNEQKFKQEMRGEHSSVEWGSQIRNYVLHPYKMIKDVRSGFETSDINRVLEQGDLLDIIWSVKAYRQKQV